MSFIIVLGDEDLITQYTDVKRDLAVDCLACMQTHISTQLRHFVPIARAQPEALRCLIHWLNCDPTTVNDAIPSAGCTLGSKTGQPIATR